MMCGIGFRRIKSISNGCFYLFFGTLLFCFCHYLAQKHIIAIISQNLQGQGICSMDLSTQYYISCVDVSMWTAKLILALAETQVCKMLILIKHFSIMQWRIHQKMYSRPKLVRYLSVWIKAKKNLQCYEQCYKLQLHLIKM